jgi:RTX calcium-binding nonapeptide repeat (4 copies)
MGLFKGNDKNNLLVGSSGDDEIYGYEGDASDFAFYGLSSG